MVWPTPKVSATKGYTGHMLAASGAFELIIATCVLMQKTIPATYGLSDIDEQCDINHVMAAAINHQAEHARSLNAGMGGLQTAIHLIRADPAA
ncbi:3-oxoacyl-[acyl-carrier-protein] synthase 2 [BD1-7 clade bacterium]|uniref:3-oxoacyl-[acyl-carrier-protein] synthase 2 n=1 Tax=BD1-7 clade bacterium TaxID=2029982 RepID=A0A5S9MNW4_9GAMM|nr:3-oxoacyl-[acyl-carrier-protein] synthase 2 [BD1-7 clade bacterium]CAA0085266.1 3-oxoacyl-[acyl-carrier-protein] synthase 2 [BD1-7 clade bacterium]